MSGEVGTLHETYREVLTHPSLSLLRRRDAALILTILTRAFGDSVVAVPADRMHGLVDDALTRAGRPDPDDDRPPPTARAVCDAWLQGETRWLTRVLDPRTGEEAYRMTPDAERALAFVSGLSRQQVVTTDTTVEALLDAAHGCALKASTDPDERRRHLLARRAELAARTADIDRELAQLDETGVVVAAPDDVVLNEFLAVQAGLETLLRDLRSVSETVRSQGEALRADFQADDRETGQIVDEYLRRLSTLLHRTREGRGYESAQRLLNDPEMVETLRADLATILAHPFADSLPVEERTAAMRMVTAIHRGTGDVLDARTRINTSFTRYLRSRHVRHRSVLPQRLREVEDALRTWEAGHGRRDALPVEVVPPGVDVATLRTQPGTAPSRATPPPLGLDDEPAAPFEASGLRHRGGPHYPDLVATIDRLLTDAESVGVAEVFDALPEDSRRPIDLYGLLALAGAADAVDPAEVETTRTVRPDGTTRDLRVPRLRFTAPPHADSKEPR